MFGGCAVPFVVISRKKKGNGVGRTRRRIRRRRTRRRRQKMVDYQRSLTNT
jgi:hypothetical protein